MRLLKVMIAASVIALGLAGVSAQAKEFVTNGGFEVTTNGVGEFDSNTHAPGWISLGLNQPNGFNFIFDPKTADTTGAPGEYGGNVSLWGPANGSNNGLTASPTGGNFAAADGAYNVGFIYQVVSGLRAGNSYTVNFDWAAAQLFGFDGPTTENFTVGLYNQAANTGELFTTNTVNLASHGFSGWMHQAYTFTATSATANLFFLAQGTPSGKPPYSLLDSVSLTGSVPEPATWAMMIVGLGLTGGALRLRRRDMTVAAA